jgi:hypothetical protein
MTLNITLTPEKEKRLRERAAAAGEDVGTFASRLLDQFAAQPTPLEQLSGPICDAFLESGMTDDELGDLLEKAKHEMRAERRAKEKQ